MAEIPAGNSHNRNNAGVKKVKKLPTRVDLTPMVDLGFLLITFFIFTTSISQPVAMKLAMPDDTDKVEMPAKESGALTILLNSQNSFRYYEGKLENEGSNIHAVSMRQIREVIIHKKRNTKEKDLFIIIKPGKESVYKDVVNVLDEMAINEIKRYALAEMTNEEEVMTNRKSGL